MFFHGEDSVTDNLSPFIDAAPRAEQKYFLATQQADEARHAVFFKRFMHEVVKLGDGTLAGGLEATRSELTHGFRQTFAALDRVTDELRRDRSATKLAQAVTLYHVLVEATLAQPGQHFIEAYLDESGLLPAFRAGMRNIALDEQRHIAFGVRLLRDLATSDPEVPEAVADLLSDVLPATIGVFVPPGWDRRYSECFGFTLEEIFEEGSRSFESKMRAAGLAVESLPSPVPYPIDASAMRISWTSSAGGSIRAGRWPRGACVRAAHRARCGLRAGCSGVDRSPETRCEPTRRHGSGELRG